MHRLSLPPRLALLVLPLLLAHSPGAHSQTYEWRRLPNAPVASRHNDVKFLDPSLGWACNTSGQLWKTTDGGDSWSQLLQVGVTLRSLYFANESIGLAGTVTENQILYRTTNGGQSWTLIDSLIPNPRPQGLCGMMGLGDRVFACGRFFGSARLIMSSDAGATWTSQDLAPHLRVAIDCRFITPDSGFVVGGAGTPVVPAIIFTSNGGQTWVTRHTGGNGDYCWKIFFVNPQVGYTSLQGQAVLKTTDGGVTWIEKPTGTTIDNIQGVGFADEMTGWVDGFSGNTLMTTDGGDTWNQVLIDPPDPAMNRFQMFSSTFGYASGRSVYKYLPATTAVHLAEAPEPTGALALTCWPNPFNPTTSIRYRVRDAGPVLVRIYTVRNETAFQLFAGHQEAGWNTITWDGRNNDGRMMPSGCYFVRVDSGRLADSQAITLLK